jgi:hypothetical protein
MFNYLNSIEEKFFNIVIYTTYFLIFVIFIGFKNYAPKILDFINYYLKIYVCLFIIWRFNPLRKVKEITSLDRHIIFNSGVIVLTTTILNSYLDYIKQEVTQQLDTVIQTSKLKQ